MVDDTQNNIAVNVDLAEQLEVWKLPKAQPQMEDERKQGARVSLMMLNGWAKYEVRLVDEEVVVVVVDADLDLNLMKDWNRVEDFESCPDVASSSLQQLDDVQIPGRPLDSIALA